MIYLAAMFFGVAVWMTNPIASGVMVFLGVIQTGMWVRDFFVTISNNQRLIIKHIHRG